MGARRDRHRLNGARPDVLLRRASGYAESEAGYGRAEERVSEDAGARRNRDAGPGVGVGDRFGGGWGRQPEHVEHADRVRARRQTICSF